MQNSKIVFEAFPNWLMSFDVIQTATEVGREVKLHHSPLCQSFQEAFCEATQVNLLLSTAHPGELYLPAPSQPHRSWGSAFMGRADHKGLI